jgi:hypothetical protein
VVVVVMVVAAVHSEHQELKQIQYWVRIALDTE